MRDLNPVIQGTDGTEASIRPVLYYLARLKTSHSRIVVTSVLNGIARRLGYEYKVAHLQDGSSESIPPWQQLDWRTLNESNIAACIASYQVAPGTRNRALTIFRGIARHTWYEGSVSDSTYAHLLEGTRRLRCADTYALQGEALDPHDFQALIAVCKDESEITDIRDAALLMVAICTGFRRSELANIKRTDLLFSHDVVRITIIGKGNHQRHALVLGRAVESLQAWLTCHANRGDYIFCPVHPRTHWSKIHHPLTRRGMDDLLKRRVQQAGIRKVNWHDFRRGVASVLIEALGIEEAAMQLGHQVLETTRRYDRRGDKVLLRTAKILLDKYGLFEKETNQISYQDANLDCDWMI